MVRDQQAELHFHALPGVDDGPATLAESVELLRAARGEGTTQVVATPHVRPDAVSDPGELPERVRELQAAAGRAGLGITLRVGGELDHRMVGRLDQAQLGLIAHGAAGARWLLVEVPFESPDRAFRAALGELGERGFGVLLAHPERSVDDAVASLPPGTRLQVNAQSLTGEHGAAARERAFALVARGQVAAIASDAHGDHRPPALRAARRALTAHGVSAHVARVLTVTAPLALLSGGLFTEPSREVDRLDTESRVLQGNLAP